MTEGLAAARSTVAGFDPPDAQQQGIRDEILRFCDAHRDALWRSCEPGHLTAAAVVVDPAGERVLLHLHRKFGRWLQLGGHCDGDGDLARVALREAHEESGIDGLALDTEAGVLDVDVHRVEPPGEASHLHHDIAFLVRAPHGAVARMSDESLDLRWFTWEEAAAIADEDRLRRLLSRARTLVSARADRVTTPVSRRWIV